MRKSTGSIRPLLLVLGVLGIFGVVGGVAYRTVNPVANIGAIKARPHDFDGKLVTIRARVTADRYTIGGRGGYFVDDGTGKIGVVTESGAPASGEQVTITGKVKVLLQTPVGDAIVIEPARG